MKKLYHPIPNPNTPNTNDVKVKVDSVSITKTPSSTINKVKDNLIITPVPQLPTLQKQSHLFGNANNHHKLNGRFFYVNKKKLKQT